MLLVLQRNHCLEKACQMYGFVICVGGVTQRGESQIHGPGHRRVEVEVCVAQQ